MHLKLVIFSEMYSLFKVKYSLISFIFIVFNHQGTLICPNVTVFELYPVLSTHSPSLTSLYPEYLQCIPYLECKHQYRTTTLFHILYTLSILQGSFMNPSLSCPNQSDLSFLPQHGKLNWLLHFSAIILFSSLGCY